MFQDRRLVHNKILFSSTSEVWLTISPHLREVTLARNQSVYLAGEEIREIYFPQNCTFSIFADLIDGSAAETAIIGFEGVLGSSVISGETTSFLDAVAQVPGQALSLSRNTFLNIFRTNIRFRETILTWREQQHCQVSQTAVCSCRHSVEQRLARRLLMAHDRVIGNEVPLSQEILALTLGVARPTISIAARHLQRTGCIQYTNGSLQILDRDRLQDFACVCYADLRLYVDKLSNFMLLCG